MWLQRHGAQGVCVQRRCPPAGWQSSCGAVVSLVPCSRRLTDGFSLRWVCFCCICSDLEKMRQQGPGSWGAPLSDDLGLAELLDERTEIKPSSAEVNIRLGAFFFYR